MNLRNPDSMNEVIGRILRYGVIISGTIITIGTLLLVFERGGLDAAPSLAYYPNQIPHGQFDVSLGGLAAGLASFQPYSLIELGVLVLLATPVSRVLASVILFALQGDKTFVYITTVVLLILLFSIFVTPFIGLFGA